MSAEYDIFDKIKKEKAVKIWRYMDFTKFVYLLNTENLYFVRSDKFEDSFEGSTPVSNVNFRGGITSNFLKEFRRYVAINSWHINEHESAAMWKLYAKDNYGIAIQSTYKRLMDALADANEEIEVGLVQYIDFQKDFSVIVNHSEYLNGRNPFYQFMYKRKSFIHEQELRAIICKRPSRNAKGGLDFSEDLIYCGIPVQVKIQTLIEKIYLHPASKPWIAELVKSVTKKYGINDNEIIRQSNLADDPIY